MRASNGHTSPTLAVVSPPPASSSPRTLLLILPFRVLPQKFPDEIICMGRYGDKERKRGVELEVGLQYLSSQSQSTGPVLRKTRRSREKDVENYSK